MILVLTIVILYSFLKASQDYCQIQLADMEILDNNYRKYQFIWHTVGSIIQVNFFLLVCYELFGTSYLACKVLVVAQITYWILFDMILNVLRKRAVLYVGKTDIIDKFILWLGSKIKFLPIGVVGILLKLSLLAITLILCEV